MGAAARLAKERGVEVVLGDQRIEDTSVSQSRISGQSRLMGDGLWVPGKAVTGERRYLSGSLADWAEGVGFRVC